jgi:predicted nucleic acid-binding protein
MHWMIRQLRVYWRPSTALVADALELVSRLEVPDLPDRIVAATAVALGAPLISRDWKIRASQVHTLW